MNTIEKERNGTMKPKEIAELVGEDEAYVLGIIDPDSAIPALDTPEKAKALYENCPAEMRPAVVKKWEKLVKQAIPALDTPEKAKALYESCPAYMRPAVVKKWKELVIPALDTPKKAEAFYRSCPAEMQPAVIMKMATL